MLSGKRFLGKRGQGAMEYLMTYGWAILVVIIVGVVIWQFVLRAAPAAKICQLTSLKCAPGTEFTWVGTNLEVVILNPLGRGIIMQNATLGPLSTTNFSVTHVGIGGTTVIRFINAQPSLCPAPATTFDARLTITFNDTLTGIIVTDTGKLAGPCPT